MPKIYFLEVENVNDFVMQLKEYITYGNIPEKNKCLLLKCSLKGEALMVR